MITCRVCKENKSQEEFYKETRNKTGYMTACKLCELERKRKNNEKHKNADPLGWSIRQAGYVAKYKAKHPDRIQEQDRRQNLRKKFGITLEQYDEILEAQDDRCAGCRTDQQIRRFAVDHDHSCCSGQKTCGKCIRGLLCHNCNTAIGLLKERADTMLRLINYLGE